MLGVINLAKVKRGTAPSGYPELYDACMRATSEGRVRIPMSATHVIETYNVRSDRQSKAAPASAGAASNRSVSSDRAPMFTFGGVQGGRCTTGS